MNKKKVKPKVEPVLVFGIRFKFKLSPLGMRRTANERGR